MGERAYRPVLSHFASSTRRAIYHTVPPEHDCEQTPGFLVRRYEISAGTLAE